MEEAGGRVGDGDFPLAPIPTDGEMAASVSVWECRSDVTGYTASSSNPAGSFSTEAHFRFHQHAEEKIRRDCVRNASGI